MGNKSLDIQRNINKIRKSSAISVCEENEYETAKMMQKLLMQTHESLKRHLWK